MSFRLQHNTMRFPNANKGIFAEQKKELHVHIIYSVLSLLMRYFGLVSDILIRTEADKLWKSYDLFLLIELHDFTP